jgi:hypothetical protein
LVVTINIPNRTRKWYQNQKTRKKHQKQHSLVNKINNQQQAVGDGRKTAGKKERKKSRKKLNRIKMHSNTVGFYRL